MLENGLGGTIDTMAKIEHHPGGYPELGLVAKTLTLRYRDGVSLRKLREKVERWEHEHGNEGFRARNLGKLPPKLAYELCHVYISLRERYPEVKPDYVDFAASGVESNGAVGLSTIYPSTFPTLREAAETYAIEDIPSLLEYIREDDVYTWPRKDLRRERAWLGDARNVNRSGVIELGSVFSRVRTYKALREFWRRRNARAELLGRPLRTPHLATSEAAFVFIHEFGHLVEGELFAGGSWRKGEKAYAALSRAILGEDKPNVRQWRNHLINYPCFVAPETTYGPHQGGETRQTETRRALRHKIAEKLGTYAPVARDEIFAEAFALSHCAAEGRRKELSQLHRALERSGLRCRNVQPKRKEG